MQILAQNDADYLFLAALCGLKGLAFERGERSKANPSGLKWGKSAMVGLEAAALGLDALKPEPGLFPNGNAGMPIALMHWRATMLACINPEKIAANLLLIDRQLNDGRVFLQGPKAGFADLCSFSWAAPHISTNASHHLKQWGTRMNGYAKQPGQQRCSELNTMNFMDAALSLREDEANGHWILTSSFA